MGIRPKIFLIFFAFGIVPMLVLVYINYLNGVGAVEALLRGDVERETAEIARDVEQRQHAQETGLVALARSNSLRDYVRGADQQRGQRQQQQPADSSTANTSVARMATDAAAEREVPDDVRADLGAFLRHNRYYAAITCLNVERRVLFRVEPDMQAANGEGLRYRTLDFLSNINVDERVWSAAERAPLRSALAREPSGIIMRYTVPVFTLEEGAAAGRGALVAEMKVEALIMEAAGSLAEFAEATTARKSGPALPPRTIVALDSKGNIIYHTNDALRYQPVTSAMPSFKAVADRMLGSESGWTFYDSTGSRWLAAYRRVAPLDISLAVAGNYSIAVGGLRRSGFLNLILCVLIGVLTSIILTLVVGRTARSIKRVTEGAVAIAGGQLDQRIEVRSNDETRLLAESFNKMSDRLGQQIAHEAEMRQFQSFFRLSAMMTHDLKNAIAALSLIVRNMENRFHREEFRADAMQSLMLATDKLRVLVAKLSGPVESLSGEYKRPRPTDLVPIIERVMNLTATPAGAIHHVEKRLPPSLIAYIDGERIERVVENLIINAVEAMGTQSGRLRVEAGYAGDDMVFFSVADTGPGMSPEFIDKRLFRAFATTKKRGVGLGLYTCREVVRAHGGQIDVESHEGSGTCFRVVLPSGLDHKS